MSNLTEFVFALFWNEEFRGESYRVCNGFAGAPKDGTDVATSGVTSSYC